MDIAVVIDGVEMLEPCMRKYLCDLFGDIPQLQFDIKSIGWDNIEVNGEYMPTETCIVNKRTEAGRLLSLIIKRHNQKKINSHEWGLRAFGHVGQCNYVLTTDCGTLFDPNCVQNLFEYMEANAGCVACTGRLRVMTAEQQADPSVQDSCDTLVESMLRRVQRYELEFEHLASRPAGSMTGYVELLPGPCAFFRQAEIKDAPLDEYFAMGYKPPQDLGLLQSNLKISEDRITSWSSVWLGDQAQYSAWVEDAIFYCEAEMTAKDLTLQRRRWLNGKFSGQVYFLSRLDVLFSSKNPMWMKLSCTLLALLQVAAFLVSYLSVATFGGTFHMAAEYLGHNMGLGQFLAHNVTSIYCTLYAILLIYHVKRWENDEKFSYTVWTVAFLANGLFVCMSLLSMSAYSIQAASEMAVCYTGSNSLSYNSSLKLNAPSESTGDCSKFRQLNIVNFAKPIALACMALLPFVTALLSDLKSLCIILNPLNMLISMLALPTYTAFFSAYSISRYADLTWGQRPTVDVHCVVHHDNVPKCSRCNQPKAEGHLEFCQDHVWLHRWVNHCRKAAYLLMVINIGATISFFYVSPVMLLAIVYINGSIQQTLALLRAVAKRMKKLFTLLLHVIPKANCGENNSVSPEDINSLPEFSGKPEPGTPVPLSFRPEVYIVGQRGMSLYEISRRSEETTSAGP